MWASLGPLMCGPRGRWGEEGPLLDLRRRVSLWPARRHAESWGGGASRGLRSAGLQALTFTLLLREGLALSSAPPPSRPETRVGVLGIWGGYR